MPARVSHPLFARLYARAAEREPAGQVEHRRELTAGLSGAILEVGAGNGSNFSHYPAAVAAVTAVEPEPYLRRRAEEVAAGSPMRISLIDATAERLPFGAGSFDAVVASLVLCSVREPSEALLEIRRVLKPGGQLRFYEHVRSRRRTLRTVLACADRSGLWPLLTGGCHPNRDTIRAIRDAGFNVDKVRAFEFAPRRGEPALTFVLGVARRADVSALGQRPPHYPGFDRPR
jgi:ubiquinone/menaquinone biosynthesis C-methylase UbiE